MRTSAIQIAAECGTGSYHMPDRLTLDCSHTYACGKLWCQDDSPQAETPALKLIACSTNAARKVVARRCCFQWTATGCPLPSFGRSLTLRHAPLFVWRRAVSPHPHCRGVAASHTTSLIHSEIHHVCQIGIKVATSRAAGKQALPPRTWNGWGWDLNGFLSHGATHGRHLHVSHDGAADEAVAHGHLRTVVPQVSAGHRRNHASLQDSARHADAVGHRHRLPVGRRDM